MSAYGRTCCPTSAIRVISPGTTPASSRRRATAAGTGAWPHATKRPSTPLTPEHPSTPPSWNPLPPSWLYPIPNTSRVLLLQYDLGDGKKEKRSILLQCLVHSTSDRKQYPADCSAELFQMTNQAVLSPNWLLRAQWCLQVTRTNKCKAINLYWDLKNWRTNPRDKPWH